MTMNMWLCAHWNVWAIETHTDLLCALPRLCGRRPRYPLAGQAHIADCSLVAAAGRVHRAHQHQSPQASPGPSSWHRISRVGHSVPDVHVPPSCLLFELHQHPGGNQRPRGGADVYHILLGKRERLVWTRWSRGMSIRRTQRCDHVWVTLSCYFFGPGLAAQLDASR